MMEIIKERTRLIFKDYTHAEKKQIEDMVAAMDNVFMYEDPDGKFIGLPTGMEQTVKKLFKYAKFIDNSAEYWPYARINPVQHSATPRNQLQIDFIKFVIENAKKKQKLAGVLSPGQGKGHPLSESIPTHKKWKRFGDLQVGDELFSVNNRITKVTGIYPLGIVDIWKLTFEDGRTVRCTDEHLWNIRFDEDDEYVTIKLINLLPIFKKCQDIKQLIYVPCYPADITLGECQYAMAREVAIAKIEFDGKEEAQCIAVDDPSELYAIDHFILTHNTFMACYSAIEVGARTLIIVPTSGIKDQWEETLINMFKVPKDRVVNIRSPKQFIKVTADFVVVSQASLAVLNKRYDLEKIMKDNKFGIKVIDEVQMWFKNIVQVDANSNIANNWYITGTFGRSGAAENALYQEMFGDLAIFREKEKKPTLFNPRPGNIYGMKPHMHVKMIWTSADLDKAQLKKVTSSMRYSEREGKWMRFGISVPAYSEMVFPSDGSMTKFLKTCLNVIAMAEREVKYGRTLVLASTISSTFTFQKYLQRMFPDKKIGTFHSKNSKEENTRNKAECDILVSTISSAGTGFDMKDLSKLVTCTMWSSWILSDQISGRLRRRPDGKDTYMWDVTDAQIPQARAWAKNRADVYKRKCKTFKVVDM